MLLSIGMMVKNEEKYLDKCLSSLIPILNSTHSELIIVDTGSTDNTVEIARKYTDKVYFHKWNNNFSEIRNIVLSYCKGEWFFCIDGDEVLEDCSDLIKFFQLEIYKNYNSAAIHVKNICDLNDETSYSILSSLRLFKKDNDFKYINAIHNQPLYKKPTKILSTKCKHYGYISNDKELMEKKYRRTAALLKNELKKNSENIYYWYQLSVSYAMHGDDQEAARSAFKAFQIMKMNVSEESIKNYTYVYTQLALTCMVIRDLKKAEYVCDDAVKAGIEHIDIYYSLGKSQLLMDKNNEAIESYEKYLAVLGMYQDQDNADAQAYCHGKKEYVYFDLFILYKRVKKFSKAIEYFSKIQDAGILTNFECIEENIGLYLNMDDYNGLENFYCNVVVRYKIRDAFIEYLEKYMDKHQVNILKIKGILNEQDSYMMLLNFREAIQNNDNSLVDDMETKNNVSELDLNELNCFYGDILYYYMKYSLYEFIDLGKNINGQKNIEIFKYLDGKYFDFKELLYKVLYFDIEEDLNVINLKKITAKYLIVVTDNTCMHFKEFFNKYVGYGICYMQLVYNAGLLENEKIYCLEDEEEAFFLYMRKANLVKFPEDKKYLYYLRKALDIYPYMNNGIKLLLDEFKQNKNVDEMEKYKNQVIKTIRLLINENKIYDASKLINEYEKIISGDPEIENIKKAMPL